MPGAGWRRFQPGEVLTASNLQSYGIDQSVQVYPGTAARGSAIGTATSEGMVSYLADQDKLQLATSSSNWVDVYPAVPLTGNVIQVVQATYTTTFTTSSTTLVDTGLTASITPKFSDSRILVLVSQQIQPVSLTNSYFMGFNIMRGTSTQIFFSNLNANAGTGAGGALAINTPVNFNTLDSPGTTSSVTYKTQVKLDGGLRIDTQLNNNPSKITLIEVR